jgi:hypothetical protein
MSGVKETNNDTENDNAETQSAQRCAEKNPERFLVSLGMTE